MANDTRIAIIFDGESWFVRHIRQIEHDLDFNEKVYRCDKHISGPHRTLKAAITAVQNRGKTKGARK